MSATIDKMAEEPIIVIRIDTGDFSPESARTFEQELTATLDAQPEPVVLINVLPEGYSPSMDDLLEATQLVRGQSHIYHHPNIKKMIAVTGSETLHLAYQGLKGEIFGSLQVKAVNELDEALAIARSTP
jgi:hypothetical protein